MKKISIYQVQLLKVMEYPFSVDSIGSPEHVTNVVREFYTKYYGGALPDREVFTSLSLNTKNKVVGIEVVSIGTLNAALVHPREVFKSAILHNAASIVVAHNHPSGDPTPSPEDIDITRRLKDAGELIGVELLDHLVIGDDSSVSLRERGYV